MKKKKRRRMSDKEKAAWINVLAAGLRILPWLSTWF